MIAPRTRFFMALITGLGAALAISAGIAACGTVAGWHCAPAAVGFALLGICFEAPVTFVVATVIAYGVGVPVRAGLRFGAASLGAAVLAGLVVMIAIGTGGPYTGICR